MNEGPERSEIEFSKHVPGSEMPRRVRGMDCAQSLSRKGGSCACKTKKTHESQIHAFSSMQKMGVEPTRYFYHTDLNRARLPIPPLLHLLPAISCSLQRK